MFGFGGADLGFNFVQFSATQIDFALLPLIENFMQTDWSQGAVLTIIVRHRL